MFAPPILSAHTTFTVVYGYKADKVISSDQSKHGNRETLLAKLFWLGIDLTNYSARPRPMS
jgi:hypothetical protein